MRRSVIALAAAVVLVGDASAALAYQMARSDGAPAAARRPGVQLP